MEATETEARRGLEGECLGGPAILLGPDENLTYAGIMVAMGTGVARQAGHAYIIGRECAVVGQGSHGSAGKGMACQGTLGQVRYGPVGLGSEGQGR